MSIGPLVPSDERLEHQITDTFATVAQSDRSWTEKVWAVAAARDGSLQVVFGLGKYTNRGVMDGFGGVSQGREQWTVRASRALGADLSTAVGPVFFEVVEPLRKIRFVLEPTAELPIAFDWTITGAVPPALEQREVHRSSDGYRVEADVVRYHHSGTATGFVELDGHRHEMADAGWFAARDHSWGVRYNVGAPPSDIAPLPDHGNVSSMILWCPVLMERADASRYALHWYYQRHAIGGWSRVEQQGAVEQPDGRRRRFRNMEPELRFRDDNRRFVEGTIAVTLEDGSERILRLRAASDTGFHLGAGLYLGYEDRWHGQWSGSLHVEGEHVADCSTTEAARRLHQLRDCVVLVDDLSEGASGVGNLQSIVTGADERLGLSTGASFL